jgi:hypothetical protein
MHTNLDLVEARVGGSNSMEPNLALLETRVEKTQE